MHDLKECLNSIPKNKWNSQVKKNLVWLAYLQDVYPFTTSVNEQIYLFMHELSTRPTCAVIGCDQAVNWINNNHYTTTCSHSCAQQLRKQTGSLSQIQEKMKSTTVDRYGVSNATQSQQVIIKRNQTLMDKYGALVSPSTRASAAARASNMNKKGRDTIKNKYGVDNASQIPGVQAKKVQTMLHNHGVTHASLMPHVQQARLDKRINRYQDLAGDMATILSWNLPSQHLQDAYENPNPRIQFKCNACDHVEELAMETFRWRTHACGPPCVKCSQINKGSLQERELRDYVISLGVNMIANDRHQLHPYELDIWLPDHNLAIEYCGLYWHSEMHGKTKHAHMLKHEKCAAKGIRLITIFEDEWLHKSQVVKDRIRNMLGLNTEKVGARQLTCKLITPVQANKFCAEYHIQGVGKTVHAYGLYQHHELVSVITFSALTPAKGSSPQSQVWELNRLCTKPNFTIPGGASRLFKAFVRDHDPIQVISYSDRRWNTGGVYAQLGFVKQHDAPPNYWYIDFKGMMRIHRYNLRKTSQDNTQLTEWENRKLQGWNRIWDCGNTKWVWNKKAE